MHILKMIIIKNRIFAVYIGFLGEFMVILNEKRHLRTNT